MESKVTIIIQEMLLLLNNEQLLFGAIAGN